MTLTDGPEDVATGLVSATSPLGLALSGREEDEEVELPLNGTMRKAFVERIEKAVGVGEIEPNTARDSKLAAVIA